MGYLRTKQGYSTVLTVTFIFDTPTEIYTKSEWHIYTVIPRWPFQHSQFKYFVRTSTFLGAFAKQL